MMEKVREAIRDIPDFPKPGILFKDITPVLSDPGLFREVITFFAERHKAALPDKIAGVESRGFIFGAALADRLGVGFVPIRKKGKLPAETIEATYDLEYGTATLELHKDAVQSGERVLLIDDLLATGGTAKAAAGLIKTLGGQVTEMDFLVELSFLQGRSQLSGEKVFAPIVY